MAGLVDFPSCLLGSMNLLMELLPGLGAHLRCVLLKSPLSFWRLI